MKRCVVSFLLELLTISAISVTLVDCIFPKFRSYSEIKRNLKSDSAKASAMSDFGSDLKHNVLHILRVYQKSCPREVKTSRVTAQDGAEDERKQRCSKKTAAEEQEATSRIPHSNQRVYNHWLYSDNTVNLSELAEVDYADLIDSLKKLNNTHELTLLGKAIVSSGAKTIHPDNPDLKILNLTYNRLTKPSDIQYKNSFTITLPREEYIRNKLTERAGSNMEVLRKNYTFECLFDKDDHIDLNNSDDIRKAATLCTTKDVANTTLSVSQSTESEVILGSPSIVRGVRREVRALVGVIVTMGALAVTDQRT